MTPRTTELAQSNQTMVLRSMSAVTQKRAAEIAGISETTLSRMKDEDLPRLCALLAALNLKVVPQSYTSVDPDVLRALHVLARSGLDSALTSPLQTEELA